MAVGDVMRQYVLALAAVFLGGLLGQRTVAQESGAPIPKDAPLTHLIIIVPDIEKVMPAYGDLWGVPTPLIQTVSINLPDGKEVEFKQAYVPMPNFYLRVVEPVTKSGPLYG